VLIGGQHLTDFELWKGKRWVIAAFLLAYFAALVLQDAFSHFQFFFLLKEPIYLYSLIAALTLMLVIFKLVYTSQAHFIKLEKLEANQFAWFSDLIFISIFYMLLLKIEFVPVPPYLTGYPIELTEVFGFYLAVYFAMRVIWQVFIQTFSSQREGVVEGSTPEQILINLLTSIAIFALTFLRFDIIDQPTSVILIFVVVVLSMIIDFTLSNRMRVEESETVDEEIDV